MGCDLVVARIVQRLSLKFLRLSKHYVLLSRRHFSKCWWYLARSCEISRHSGKNRSGLWFRYGWWCLINNCIVSFYTLKHHDLKGTTNVVSLMAFFKWYNFGTYLDRKTHDDVIKWKHFPLYWPFVRGIHRSPVNSTHKGQWRGALMFSLICVWIKDWVNNRETDDLRRYHAHYDVIVMANMCRRIRSSLIWTMDWCQFGASPSSKPMLTHSHTFKWNFNQNASILFQIVVFENAVSIVSAILFWPQWDHFIWFGIVICHSQGL